MSVEKYLLDIAGEMNTVERCCADLGLTLKWLPDGDEQPRTDMERKIIYMPRPWVGMTPQDRARYRAYLWHEGGHHHPSQAKVVPMMTAKGIDFSSKKGYVINGILDVWNERVTSRQYPGAGSDLSLAQGWHINEALPLIMAGEGDAWTRAVFHALYGARAKWQGHEVTTPAKKFCDLTEDTFAHLMDRINGVVDHENPEQELFDLADEMCEGQSNSEEPDSGRGGDDGDNDDGDGKATMEKFMVDDHATKEEIISKVQNGEKIDWEEYDGPFRHKPVFERDEEALYDPYPNDMIERGVPDRYMNKIMHREIMQVYDEHAQVSHKISNLFQSASQTKKQFNRKRGKLVTQHLVRGAMGDPNIFSRKIDRVDTNADVYLLVDESGSMGWGVGDHSLMALASASAIALGQALEKAHVPFKIAGFSDTGKLVHDTIKDWHERMDVAKCTERFAMAPMAGNSDGDSLLEASRDLLSRGNRRPILIVLSDGEPAGCRDGDSYEYLQRVCKQLESKLELYGIGIESNCVERFYSEYTVLDSANDIEKCLTDLVRRKIIKR